MKRFTTTDLERLQLRAQIVKQVHEKLTTAPGATTPVKSVQASASVMRTLKELDVLAVRAP